MKAIAPLLLFALPLRAAENPHVEFAFGVLAKCRGDEPAAVDHFEKALKLDPSARALVELGVSWRLEAGDRSGAVALYREFAAARKDETGVQIAYADFLAEQGRGDALAVKIATEVLEDVLSRNPGSTAVIRRLCSLDRSRAAGWIATLSAEDPEAVLLYASISKSLHDSEDVGAMTEVERRYLAAIASHPEHADLARAASDHFRQSKRADKAIDILGKHVAAGPWSLDLRVRLGVLDFANQHNAEGERILNEVLAVDPKRALAHQALAKFYRMQGKPEQVVFHSGELLKIRGGSPVEFMTLADEFLAAGKPRDARLLLEHGVFEHPDEGKLRVKLAIASQLDPESRSRAARLFREAESAFPEGGIKDPRFLEASAEALIANGQSRAAEERLRAAIRVYPADAKAETARTLRRLADLWESEGRNLDAAKALRQRAEALAPK